MAEYLTVARAADIPPGTAKAVRVNTKVIALFNRDGQFFAIDDMCRHMGAPLSEGVVEDGAVTCSWHGWRFCLRDGTWMNSPRVKTGSYAVRVVEDMVQVEV